MKREREEGPEIRTGKPPQRHFLKQEMASLYIQLGRDRDRGGTEAVTLVFILDIEPRSCVETLEDCAGGTSGYQQRAVKETLTGSCGLN
ncbi:hypothetical protein SKAU_G00268410 [Synaphobranchus kaupii]|uniref:Uncharacterized protein n=1 Tax=Synaphobranchus kaupii TaxID=118154 RepID=A0A9Q1EZS9_SYNKA|nr:hypothetical protein SKAU_G00268410 [Synaphobranchus kaupii]